MRLRDMEGSGVNSMKIALINKQFEIDGLIKLHRLGRTE